MVTRVKGFSALELATALALASVALALAIPSMQRFAQDSAAVAAHNDLRSAIAYARNQAVQLASPVSVCASVDGRHCDPEADWSAGWIAFTDRGSAGTVDGSDRVLRVWAGPGEAALAIEADGDAQSLRFSSRGSPLPAGTSVSWSLEPPACTPGTAAAFDLDVSAAGAVRSQRRACR